MLKKSVGLCVVGLLLFYQTSFSQVDTTFIYKTGMPYGTLDLRIAKSATRYHYLQEGKTFSYRESAPGVKTNTYRDMTSWDSSPYTQGNLREKNGSNDAFIMNYRLLFPGGYNPTVAEGYPLIVMVHGLGERGNCWDNSCYWDTRSWKPSTNTPPAPTSTNHELLNNDHNLLHGGNVHLQMRNAAGTKLPNDPSLPTRSFQGFMLFPQNLNGWDGNSAQDLIRIVRLLSKKYNIDPNRIYIHGLSNGGAAVYDMLKRAPWLFSAAAPMSAVADGGVTTTNLTSKVAHIPLWIFQGGLDGNPTPNKTEGYIKKFREAGMTIRYSKYPNIGHGTWNTAYNEPDFFSWLRSKHKSEIHVFADNPTLCTTTGQGVKMDLAEGYLAYQWERNGVIISGATSAQYIATSTGTYRARFSRKSTSPTEAQWNRWSDPVTVTSSSPAQAQVKQTGTVLLKDLNNYGNAHLSSVAQADHYYWYKDGVLVDLPGSLDDTTRNPIFKAGNCTGPACTGNGVYTLVTAGFNNCPSPASQPKYIYFNNQAPVNITAPATFTGSATSATTTTLNWANSSSNETGFEIWRRKQTGATTFTKWAMATLTNANVTSFNDSGLEPGSTYQYKIRAVSISGRSNYTPAASNQYLVINTLGDTQNPTIPQNLAATSTGIREVTLSWQASTDNTGIREYNIYYGSTEVASGTAVTSYKLTNLTLNTNYSFIVRAEDLGGNLSAPSNAAAGNTFMTGLYYEHSTGAWTDLDLINWNVAEFKGKVDNFTLTPRTQEDYFNFEFDGFVYIDVAGSYQFQSSSDDGSRITLDNTVIVDNDGAHSTTTVSSALLTLGSGPHAINVKYFENAGGQNLTVRYKGPDTGNAWVAIPNSALRSGDPEGGASMMMASASPEPESSVSTEDFAEPVLSIYPNPAPSGENVKLQMDTEGKSRVHVQVINMMGKSFYQETFNAEDVKSTGLEIAPREKMTRGIYLIILKQGNHTIKKRVIVDD